MFVVTGSGWRAPIEPAHSGGLCLQRWCWERVHDVRPCWWQSTDLKQEVPHPPPHPPIYDTFASLKLQDSEEEEEIMRIYRSSCNAEGCTSQEKGAVQSRPGDLLRGTSSPLASQPPPSTPVRPRPHCHFLSSPSIDLLHPLVRSFRPFVPPRGAALSAALIHLID